ncbi:MAG: sigma-70 family RNA polymerase sigma factor [Oscillospiraceae bacterium]|nr:sigma-70 family RNA polymerase sigma factor [Oscillospiraceae bacterium]
MDDEQIIWLYENRNEQALKETISKYGTMCREIAGRLLPNKQDIEECINDMLLQTWNSIPPAHPDCFPAYITLITRNLALNRIKYTQRLKRTANQHLLNVDELAECVADADNVEHTVDHRMLAQWLEIFLDRQKPLERAFFVQRYVIFRSVSEIAAMYNVSESKVKVTLFRMRKRLKHDLKQEGWI